VKQLSAKLACKGYWESCADVPGLREWSEAEALIDQYVGLLLQVSKRRSLLAASQRNEDSLWGHVFDSLQALRMVAESGATVVMDAGSGNGLPGVPLAAALPSVSFVLVERTEPKAEFLELVSARCGLRNVTVRAADLSELVVGSIQPGLVIMRALVSADSALLPRWMQSLTCPWIVFATSSNHPNWIRLAGVFEFAVCDELEYVDVSGLRPRLLLKFANL